MDFDDSGLSLLQLDVRMQRLPERSSAHKVDVFEVQRHFEAVVDWTQTNTFSKRTDIHKIIAALVVACLLFFFFGILWFGEAVVGPMTELSTHVFVSCSVMFTEGFLATMILPYASFMVSELRGTEKNLGVASGMVFTAVPIGSMLTACLWGRLANRIGRRPCVLLSLAFGAILAIATAFCDSYESLLILRFTQGLLNCSVSTMRTSLRERVSALGGNEVLAFATLQATFAASAILGPAIGGTFYGFGAEFVHAWVAPQLVAAFLYMLALALVFVGLAETASTSISGDSQHSKDGGNVWSGSFFCLLVMVAGHSFVFTGWELGYPLFARDAEIGQAWTSRAIGMTFLVGSTGLMLYNFCVFTILSRHLSLDSIWMWSWLPNIILMPLFPRVVIWFMDRGVASDSFSIVMMNYSAQLFVSVLIGSQFLTLQLMLNKFVAKHMNCASALSIANGWFGAAQSLARAISPFFTGTLFARAHGQDHALPFDGLALTGLISCVIVGFFFRRSADLPSCSSKNPSSIADGVSRGFLGIRSR